MTDLVDAIAGTLGDILGLPAVGAAGRVALVAMVALWLAAAWWTWRDAGARSEDPLVRMVATAGVVLATPLLFPLAVLLYVLLRPRSRLGLDRDLELRMLALGPPADPDRCPACDSMVEAGWRRCPACGTHLSLPCPSCARPARTHWAICAWCAAELPWAGEGAAASGDPGAAAVAIPIVPGGRPWLPVMAVPGRPAAATPEEAPDVAVEVTNEPVRAGALWGPTAGQEATQVTDEPVRAGALRGPAAGVDAGTPGDTNTPHDLGGDQIVRRVVHGQPRHRHDRGGWDR